MERYLALWVGAVAGVVGGAAGGIGCFLLMREARPVVTTESIREEAVRVSDPELNARVLALENAVRSVRSRLAENSVRTLSATGAATAGLPVAASDAARGTGALVDDPLFEAAVRDIVIRTQEDRGAERAVRRDDRWRARADRYANQLETKLALTAEQKARVAEITFKHWDTLRQRSAGDGGEPDLTQEQRRELASQARAETERALQEVLDPGQMYAYRRLGDRMKIGNLGVFKGAALRR